MFTAQAQLNARATKLCGSNIACIWKAGLCALLIYVLKGKKKNSDIITVWNVKVMAVTDTIQAAFLCILAPCIVI